MSSHKPRPGEVAVELPAAYDAGLYFIGRIRTPWARREDCPKNSGESQAVCTIEVSARYADGLRDIETVSHLILLYFMDEAPRDILLQAPNHYRTPHGTFAQFADQHVQLAGAQHLLGQPRQFGVQVEVEHQRFISLGVAPEQLVQLGAAFGGQKAVAGQVDQVNRPPFGGTGVAVHCGLRDMERLTHANSRLRMRESRV